MSIDPSIPPVPAPPAGPVVSASDPTDGYTAAAPDPHQPPAAAPAPPAAATGDNTVAVLSYLTLIGFIVAVVLNKDEKKNRLGAFHLRQSLGLIILSFGLSVVLAVLSMALPSILANLLSLVWLGVIAAWVIGFLAALNRQEKPIPLIGEPIQNLLKGVFAN